MTPTIQTVSGKIIDFTKPEQCTFDLEDIAHGLSQTCRFAGQSKFFYSVAQHAVLVSTLVPPDFALEALHHDDTEAFMCDVPTPLKLLLPEYIALEARMDAAIRLALGLPLKMSARVKEADALALSIEKPFVCVKTDMEWSRLPCTAGYEHIDVEPMTSEQAKRLYLERHRELTEAL